MVKDADIQINSDSSNHYWTGLSSNCDDEECNDEE